MVSMAVLLARLLSLVLLASLLVLFALFVRLPVACVLFLGRKFSLGFVPTLRHTSLGVSVFPDPGTLDVVFLAAIE